MIAYHGTTKENKIKIIEEGFRSDTKIKQGKLYGDAIYFTTSRKRAKDFGSEVIKAEIDVSKFRYFYHSDKYDDFFSYYVNEVFTPYNSLEDYLVNKFISIKVQLESYSQEELKSKLNQYLKEAEYKVGTAIKRGLIKQGYNGVAILLGEEDLDYDYFELTVYDLDKIKILN